MGSEGARPASALAAVTDLLDLRPAATALADGPGRTRLGLVAGRAGPRFLVPLGHPGAAPASCLAYLGLRDTRTRIQRGAVGVGLRLGLHRLVAGQSFTADVGPGSLVGEIARVLGVDEVAVGVGLGRIDEVWKPTLQVFDPDGTPLAFVKIGLGPVADELVATEAATLAAWGRQADPRLVVPGLLADTSWRGIRLVVVAPLPTDVRRLPPGIPSAWGVRTLDGPEVAATLAASPWWQSRRRTFADDPSVGELLDRVEARHGDAELGFARAHGDWVPWNLARCHLGLVAWDWEYSEGGGPVGIDETHGCYQQARVVEGRPIAEALAAARAVAPSPGVAGAHLAMLVTRSARLAQLAGRPPGDQVELFDAARRSLR